MKRSYRLALGVATCVAVGAGLMFFLDPRSGARRRATVRDKTRHGVRATTGAVNRASTNLMNHTRGLVAAASAACGANEVPDDDVLLARVRARVGHAVANARPIELKASGGVVSVAGTLEDRDARRVLRTIAHTRGVAGVESHLAIAPVG